MEEKAFLSQSRLPTDEAVRGRKKSKREKIPPEVREQHDKTIMEMWGRRFSESEIALAIQKSKGYVHKAIRRLTAQKKVLHLKRTHKLTREASTELGISESKFKYLCDKIGVPHRGKGRLIAVSKEELDRIHNHALMKNESRCLVCGVSFHSDWRKSRRLTCESGACALERRRRNKEKLDNPETGSSGRPWFAILPTLIKRYKNVSRPRLHRGKAARFAEITFDELDLLVRNGILETHKHPTRTWRGRPQLLFRESDMRLVRYAYREYVTKRGPT